MKIINTAINEACADDDFRSALKYVWLQKGELLATNGKILVVIPVMVDPGDLDGPIPVEAVMEMRRLARERGIASMKCRKNTVVLTTSTRRVIYARGYDLSKQEVGWKEIMVIKKPREYVIGFNPALLSRLVMAMNKGDDDKIVKLEFYGKDDPIHVSIERQEAKGLLMPGVVDDDPAPIPVPPAPEETAQDKAPA